MSKRTAQDTLAVRTFRQKEVRQAVAVKRRRRRRQEHVGTMLRKSEAHARVADGQGSEEHRTRPLDGDVRV